jgi:hypothetical protein
MNKKARRKECQAVQLLDQAVRRYASIVQSGSSYKPNTDRSVATFERYVRKLRRLSGIPGKEREFWFLHQKVYIKLLKQTLKLSD